MKETLSDVLADRYASTAMVDIWSPKQKAILQRKLWVAALKAQCDLGVSVPEGAIEAYEKVIEAVNLDSIARRELKTRHEVKAQIEEFNALAGGFELIHEGFTSRDSTDNIEQLQIFQSLKLLCERTIAVLHRLGARADEYVALDMCGRSHNVPAQTVTLGKRFTNVAEEMLIAFDRLEHLIALYPLRGIKGPMGTQQDMVNLLGSAKKALEFEERLREHLGFSRVFTSVGQVYPRSLDFEVVSTLVQLASAPANLAKMIRLMAGQGLAHEGFGEGQTGSTAMPHKINSRTCERMNGLKNVLGGFLDMTESLVGDQWLEGDVSCSVVRRVALPGSFFALDGIYEAAMTVLDEMEVFPLMIEAELKTYLPFLSTTRIFTSALKRGMGRETAHRIIKRHATAAVHAIREGLPSTFVERLAADDEFPLDLEEIKELVERPDHGIAPTHVEKVCDRIMEIVVANPGAAAYDPEPIR